MTNTTGGTLVPHLWKSVLLTGVLSVILGAMVLAEWAVGCGETYTDAKGVTHSNQCLFLNATKGEIK